MNIASDINKVRAKLKASEDSEEAIIQALVEEREKKNSYDNCLNSSNKEFDHESLVRGLVSIKSNILALEQAIGKEEALQKLLTDELLGLEALSRIQSNGHQE